MAVKTSASIAADVLSFIATGSVLVTSIVDHQRALRSSSLISLYLSTYGVLGIARARTLWLISPGTSISTIMIAVVALNAMVLMVDSIKRSSKKLSDKSQYSPEQYSGFWNRAIWAWLAATFRVGYTKTISVDDLPPLDSKLESHKVHHELLVTWDRSKTRTATVNGILLTLWKDGHHPRHSLLRACIRSFLPSLLSPVMPRLCLTAFTFCQPFLLNSTVSLVEQSNPNRNYGKGLIGAWALVFLGIAVCIQTSNSSGTLISNSGCVAFELGVSVSELPFRHQIARKFDSFGISAVSTDQSAGARKNHRHGASRR